MLLLISGSGVQALFGHKVYLEREREKKERREGGKRKERRKEKKGKKRKKKNVLLSNQNYRSLPGQRAEECQPGQARQHGSKPGAWQK